MDIRDISPSYSVTPQIEPADLPAIKAAGFTTVICNRPDAEVPAELQAEALRIATEAAGLRFVLNPLSHGNLTMEIIETQGRALAESDGKVLGYCASGNRCTVLWSFAMAGKLPTDEIIAAGTRAGYQTEGLRPQIEQLAAQG
ncbi:TIGR01244 family sulfur transferase [Pseudoruegeria sp. SHC-113]|uniref:TIGR01244 family sulfur transferase n=1 Tax=Pseudoruegeria sp. SHC-113 TaxID=2855439 RepID=UPI0021BB5E7A|nr:TIGR01244 family sulfur transferase [Pseudoruegeria sp. SHC-113]MCT8159925.1 TIGR01244 family phosphatase [Pseudoruegeria sp. SHC-113]